MSLACTSFASEAIAHALQKNVMIEDISGNAHHGVYVGDFTSKSDGAYMDGTLDQFGVIPDHADLRITTTSGVFSIEFWIRSSSFANEGATGQRAICKNEDASNQWAVTFTDDIANGGGRLTMGVDYAGATYSVTGNVGNNVIPYNVRSHCVITMNATTPLLYVNGILVTTTGSAPGLGSGANFLLGRLAQDSSTGRFTGILRRVAYYPTVLTPIQILTHYAAGDIPNTNMIARSQEFDNASWTKVRSSITANSTTAPDGSATADTLVEDASVSTTHYCFNSNIAATNSTVFTYSVHAKTKERSQIRLYVQEGAFGGDFFYAHFDVTLGTVLSTGSGGTGVLWSATITASAQGFYRCAVTGIYGTTGTTLDAIIQLASGGTTIYTGNGTSGIYLWGAQLEQQAAVHRYIPTVAAAVTITSYNATILLDTPKSLWPMEEDSAQQLDSWPQKPINVAIGNVSHRSEIMVNTLKIEDTLGEQVTSAFTVVNPELVPVVGDQVRIWFYDQVLFAGSIDRITRTTNNTLTARHFDCTCMDWSQVLVRNTIERNFIDTPIESIVDSLLDNELAGEGLTLGISDRHSSVPLADSKGGNAFNLLRDLAGVTGQTFYVDFDKAIQFRVTSNDAAPLILDLTSVEHASLMIDRETYRNVQRVRVTGTPAEGSGGKPLVTIQERTNASQIAERAAIEGGTGRYEYLEEVEHPTSNDGIDIALLGIGYANLRLATSGVPRQTLSCRVRSYGFRSGQFATVDISTLGVSGTWLVQRISIAEEDGRHLVHQVELVQSSLQQRAYESWLRIVQGGRITVQMPSALTSNLQTFDTPGADTWTVPSGVTTAEFTCYGPGGGGCGALYIPLPYPTPAIIEYGGDGGNGGKAVTVISVTEGQVFDVVVGAAGVAGVSIPPGGFDWGTDGGTSSVALSAVTFCQGDGGKRGERNNVNGAPGNGVGDAVSVGGGNSGGAGGIPNGAAPQPGNDGLVEVRW